MVNLAVGYSLYGLNILPYFISVFISSTAGLLVNFLLNYFFNFKFRGRTLAQQFNSFFIVAMFGTILTAIIAWCTNAILAVNNIYIINIYDLKIKSQFLSHVISVGGVTIYSFFAHKYFSFNIGIKAQCKKIILKSGLVH